MVALSTAKLNTMRAAKMKASSTKPAGGIKRSCQERPQPDTATPKAMKDPNWRTRLDTSSSTDIENIIPSTDQPNNKFYPHAASFHSSHSSYQERNSSDFSIADRLSSEASSASENFVKILKKIDLKAIDGRQMSIFELDVRPETPTPSIIDDDRRYAKVSRNAASHQRDSSSATEVTSSSHSTDNIQTPDVFQAVTLDRLCRQPSSATSSHSQLLDSRSIYERDKNVGVSLEQTVPVARDRTPVDGPTRSPQTAIRNSRDQAFQRLIQRLNRDSHSSAGQASRSPITMQTAQKPHEPGFTNKLPANIRRPVGGGGRRNQTISDFKVDYWEHSQASETSREGSEATVQNSSRKNTWNPKAREFLSLGHQQSPRRPLPWDNRVSGPQERASNNTNSLGTSINAAWPKATTQPFDPYQPTKNQDAIPNGTFNPSVPPLAPSYNVGLGPATFNPAHTFNPTHFLPGGAAPQQPFFHFPPLSDIQAASMPFGNFSANIAAQQIAALPYFASLASVGPLPQLLAGLEKPKPPVNTRRPPVPKPAMPNAGDQLAYEEWIEWRKANEPGYAIECKARQQRRSQRVKGAKEGGGGKSAESRLAPARAVAAA